MNTTLAALAKSKVGDAVYRVLLIPRKEMTQAANTEGWMANCHPKVLFRNRPWNCSHSVPKVSATDFVHLMTIFTSRLTTRLFEVEDINRSRHTGEMEYLIAGEWFPEPILFATASAAQKEIDRILEVARRWSRDEL